MIDVRYARLAALAEALEVIRDQRRRARGRRRMLFVTTDGVRFACVMDSTRRPVIDYRRLTIGADGPIPREIAHYDLCMLHAIVSSGVDVAVVRREVPRNAQNAI